MSDTLDWICNEIGADKAIILSRRHDKKAVFFRRIAYWFFKLKGKSSTWTGNLFNRDHSSVLVAEEILSFGAKEVHVKKEQFLKSPACACLLKLSGNDYNKRQYREATSVDKNVAEVLFARYVAKKMAECKK